MTDCLAIDGGTPVRTAPVPSWPAPSAAQIEAVRSVLASGRINYWTGEHARTFEREYAAHVGRAHGIAVANGTLALEIALRAAGVGPGDEVVVPARTFIATAAAAVAVGATPVVADVDPATGLLDAVTLEAALTPRTAAVIPVHVGGWPVEMGPLLDVAGRAGLTVVEDCAQAHGATIDGRSAGSLGRLAAFSFCQDKIVPLGEGGMIVTDDEALSRAAWAYKDHGKAPESCDGPADGTFRWLADSFGSNARLGEMEGAMGRVALGELPGWLERRRASAQRLTTALADVPALEVPRPRPGIRPAFYRLYARVRPEALRPGWDRDRIVRAVRAEGVPAGHGTCAAIHHEAAFARAGVAPARPLPAAELWQATQLAFPVHPGIGDDVIDDLAAALHRVMGAAT